MDPFHGETPCQASYKNGNKCKNKAYFKVGDSYVCGQHSRGKDRVELRKDPDRHRKRLRELEVHAACVEATSHAKRSRSEHGSVSCVKLRMMRPVPLREGFLNVFPNYKHANRTDGRGCRTLSPKAMGPIDHGIVGLPVAQSIENFHQFNKFFGDKETMEEFVVSQRRGYEDLEPHRHKFSGVGNEPTCAFLPVPEGGDITVGDQQYVRFDYLTSRYFYCHFYELQCRDNNEFRHLKRWKENGRSLQIVGYDGFPMEWNHGDNMDEELMQHYLDTSKPFGHEAVLFTLLVVSDPAQYPWNRFWVGEPWFNRHFPHLAPLE